MKATIDLSKATLQIGDPLVNFGGDVADGGDFLRISFPNPRTQRLVGVYGSSLVTKGPSSIIKEDVDIELTLVESGPQNKTLYAFMASGVGLPITYRDGDKKIVGTCQISKVPDTSKSTAGGSHVWMIHVVQATITFGASASTDS